MFGLQLVGDEAVPECRVGIVDLQRGLDQVGVGPVPCAHGVGLPLVEGLRRELEHPAGHHDGDTVRGKVQDQRVDHFGLRPWPR